VLLPETDLDGAIALAEKIRADAATRLFGEGGRVFRLTLSAGASCLRDDESGHDMIARADLALYHAKARGRNRVESALTDLTKR
jgi:diguanylate cyclase (GGDEF)-like protein